jgi:hypothetical protein
MSQGYLCYLVIIFLSSSKFKIVNSFKLLFYSSTHERKSKTYIVAKNDAKNDKITLKHNSISEEIPIVIVMKVKDTHFTITQNLLVFIFYFKFTGNGNSIR